VTARIAGAQGRRGFERRRSSARNRGGVAGHSGSRWVGDRYRKEMMPGAWCLRRPEKSTRRRNADRSEIDNMPDVAVSFGNALLGDLTTATSKDHRARGHE